MRPLHTHRPKSSSVRGGGSHAFGGSFKPPPKSTEIKANPTSSLVGDFVVQSHLASSSREVENQVEFTMVGEFSGETIGKN